MPSPEVASLKQTAVLWTLNGYDRHGEPQRGSATEISARWESAKTAAVGDKAEPIAKPITVYVDRDIEIGSTLWLGELADVPAGTADLTNLFIVTGFNKMPDIRGRVFTRSVTAMRQV